MLIALALLGDVTSGQRAEAGLEWNVVDHGDVDAGGIAHTMINRQLLSRETAGVDISVVNDGKTPASAM